MALAKCATTELSSWPGLSRPSTSLVLLATKTWMPGTRVYTWARRRRDPSAGRDGEVRTLHARHLSRRSEELPAAWPRSVGGVGRRQSRAGAQGPCLCRGGRRLEL